MSIIVENNLKNTANEEVFDQKAHYIPCKVDDNGTANVRKYFEPYITNDDNGGKYSQLRSLLMIKNYY